MNKRQLNQLQKEYKKYRTVKQKKQKVLGFFRDFMGEMIYRTSKLEGEPVTRKMITSLFGNK